MSLLNLLTCIVSTLSSLRRTKGLLITMCQDLTTYNIAHVNNYANNWPGKLTQKMDEPLTKLQFKCT